MREGRGSVYEGSEGRVGYRGNEGGGYMGEGGGTGILAMLIMIHSGYFTITLPSFSLQCIYWKTVCMGQIALIGEYSKSSIEWIDQINHKDQKDHID